MPDRLDNDVLKIRCVDNRTRKANAAGECPNQKRLIGGVLEADFLEKFFDEQLPEGVHHRILMFKIDELVKMKKPKKIVIASHEHCGAAAALGYDHATIVVKHKQWGERLRKHYPDIEVVVLHEKHSECGFHHEGYVDIDTAA